MESPKSANKVHVYASNAVMFVWSFVTLYRVLPLHSVAAIEVPRSGCRCMFACFASGVLQSYMQAANCLIT